MDFTLSKQQAMVQKMYKEFAENEVKPLAKKVDAEEYFPKETVMTRMIRPTGNFSFWPNCSMKDVNFSKNIRRR